MPDGRALSTARLLVARANARRGLLLSTTATVAVAVATVCALLGSLSRAVAAAAVASSLGVSAEEIAAQVDAGIAALAGAAPALVLLVTLLAATATAQLARLLAVAREYETANARARGLSAGQAARIDAVEAAGIAVVGALGGLAASVVINLGLAFWWTAPITAAVLAVVLVVAARRPPVTGGRRTRAAAASLVGLVVLAAAFSAWQLRSARPGGFDPIVAVAPTLVLLGGALLVLAAFGAGAGAWARVAARGRAITPTYPSRQVARRLPVYAVAVLLVGLSVSQIIFASSFGATWTRMATNSSALRAGADLRVDLEPQTVTPGLVAAASFTSGIDAAAPALVTPIEIGNSGAELIAIPTNAIRCVVTSAGGVVDRGRLVADVEPADGTVSAALIPLGPQATGLNVTVAVQSSRSGGAAGLQLVATVRDAAGTTAQVRLSGVTEDAAGGADAQTLTVEGALPDGTAPWSLMAVTATVLANFRSTDLQVSIVQASAIGAEQLPIDGQAVLNEGSREVLWLADGDGVAPEEPPPVRVVLTTALAERLGLGVGDAFEFRYAGAGRRGEVEVGGIVPAVPGAATTLAVFAPLEILQVSMLQRGTSTLPGTSVWASGNPNADAALSATLDGRPVATAAPGVTANVVGALVTGWWIATGGSVVLSLIAVVAIVQTLALARARELGVLRALGATSRAQARLRAAELVGVIATTVVLSFVGGVFVSWLIVPDLVRATTPGILPLGGGIEITWPALVAALGVLVACLTTIVGISAASVRRSSAAATVGEVSR